MKEQTWNTPNRLDYNRIIRWTMALAILCCINTGCAIRTIALYDSDSMAQITQLSDAIERLYFDLEIRPEEQRVFSDFSSQYYDIELQIRLFSRRQSWRPLNEETHKQSEILLELWQQDVLAHKASTTLTNLKIKLRLNQYRRLLDTIARGELAKKETS